MILFCKCYFWELGGQLNVIPLLIIFFILMTCPLDIVLILFGEISPWWKGVKGLSLNWKWVYFTPLTKCPSFDKCSLPPPLKWAPFLPLLTEHPPSPPPMCAHPQCHYIKQVTPFNKQSTSSLIFLKSRNTRVTGFYCHFVYNFASFKYKGISTGWLFLDRCPPSTPWNILLSLSAPPLF